MRTGETLAGMVHIRQSRIDSAARHESGEEFCEKYPVESVPPKIYPSLLAVEINHLFNARSTDWGFHQFKSLKVCGRKHAVAQPWFPLLYLGNLQ